MNVRIDIPNYNLINFKKDTDNILLIYDVCHIGIDFVEFDCQS